MRVLRYEGDRVVLELSLINFRHLLGFLYFGDQERDPMEGETIVEGDDLDQQVANTVTYHGLDHIPHDVIEGVNPYYG